MLQITRAVFWGNGRKASLLIVCDNDTCYIYLHLPCDAILSTSNHPWGHLSTSQGVDGKGERYFSLIHTTLRAGWRQDPSLLSTSYPHARPCSILMLPRSPFTHHDLTSRLHSAQSRQSLQDPGAVFHWFRVRRKWLWRCHSTGGEGAATAGRWGEHRNAEAKPLLPLKLSEICLGEWDIACIPLAGPVWICTSGAHIYPCFGAPLPLTLKPYPGGHRGWRWRRWEGK